MKTEKELIEQAVQIARLEVEPITQADHETRNRLARMFFKRETNRKLLLDGCEHGQSITVETWWDSQSRNYITEVLDSDSGEVFPSEYTGHKDDAAVAHIWALIKALRYTGKIFTPAKVPYQE